MALPYFVVCFLGQVRQVYFLGLNYITSLRENLSSVFTTILGKALLIKFASSYCNLL